MGKFSSGKVTLWTALATLTAAVIFAVYSISLVSAHNDRDNDNDEVKVIVCHKAGQSGNYNAIDVSIHSVNDANGLKGHGNHNGDVWGPFTYNGVNYAGQGNYSVFNFSNCTQNSPSASPSPSPTPTARPTVNPTTTPVETAAPTAIPTDAPATTTTVNYDGKGDGLGCAVNDCSGNKVEPPQGQGQVLGASTMAGTGSFAENLYAAIMVLGGTLSAFGIKGFRKNQI